MFSEKYSSEMDAALIKESIDGNKKSLERLIRFHQDYIYNVSLRFFSNPDDAGKD